MIEGDELRFMNPIDVGRGKFASEDYVAVNDNTEETTSLRPPLCFKAPSDSPVAIESKIHQREREKHRP